MDLRAYLDRIGFHGQPRPDLETLRALHRRHLHAIPYENLDVQLGRPMSQDPARAFEKLVAGRRGGWCYEMNGLFAAVLEEVGFRVTRMAGAVRRAERGEEAIGNHLVLRVDLDEPWLVDVGFGDGMLEPIPLKPGAYDCAGYRFRLEQLDDTWWRFHNHHTGSAPSFDFTLEAADPALFARVAEALSTSPDSTFVQILIFQRHTPHGVKVLLGRVLRLVTPTERILREIATADELVAVLRDEFGVDAPETAALWPAICERHDLIFEPVNAEG